MVLKGSFQPLRSMTPWICRLWTEESLQMRQCDFYIINGMTVFLASSHAPPKTILQQPGWSFKNVYGSCFSFLPKILQWLHTAFMKKPKLPSTHNWQDSSWSATSALPLEWRAALQCTVLSLSSGSVLSLPPGTQPSRPTHTHQHTRSLAWPMFSML